MEFLQIRGLRSKRILEWKILALLVVFIIATSWICLQIYLADEDGGGGEDYDYFYFQHESLELFGEHESNERVVISNPAVVKTKQDEESLLPVIFIGGYPRSGTKVLKELIEYYAHIQCNNQTYVIPDILQLRDKWNNSKAEMHRLDEAGIDEAVLSSSLAAFTSQIVIGQSPKSQAVYCVHEDESYKYGGYLNKLFPTVKFVFVVRDGRAVIHSLKTKIPERDDFRFESYYDGFVDWGRQMEELMDLCESLGDEKCFILRFEDLFLTPWEILESLFNFLGTHFEVPVDLSRSPIRNSSVVFDYLSHRPTLDQEALNEAAVIDGTLEAFGYDPKLFVAGNSAQDFKI